MHENKMYGVGVSFIYVGTVVGAGFATGQEVLRFFVRHGHNGLYGIIITSLFLGLAGGFVISNNKQGIEKILSRWNKLFDLFLFFAWIMVSGAMFSAVNAVFDEYFFISPWIGSISIGFLCYLVCRANMKGLSVLNSVIVPAIFAAIIILWAGNDYDTTEVIYRNTGLNWIPDTFFYASCNFMLAISILMRSGKEIKTKFNAYLVSGIGAFLIGLLLLMEYSMLINAGEVISQTEIPILGLSLQIGSWAVVIYIIILFCGVFSTLCSLVISIDNTIKKWTDKSNGSTLIYIITVSILLGRISLSKIVGNIYPVLGFCGFLFIILIISQKIKMKLRL